MSLFRHGARRRRSLGECGHSLVELLVVLALLGIVAMASLPYVTGRHGSAGLGADARMLAARLRLAREMALATRLETAVTVGFVPPRMQGPGMEKPYALRAVERLALDTAKGRAGEGDAVIFFAPDGSSSGAVLRLESGSQQRTVEVDWLTGAVRIGGGRS